MRVLGSILGSILGFLAIIVVFVGLTWGGAQFELFYQRHFAPRYEEVKHEVWSNTTERIEGMTRQLSDLKFEYDKAEDDIERKAITNRIRVDFANFDLNKIDNATLRQFLNDVMSGYIK